MTLGTSGLLASFCGVELALHGETELIAGLLSPSRPRPGSEPIEVTIVSPRSAPCPDRVLLDSPRLTLSVAGNSFLLFVRGSWASIERRTPSLRVSFAGDASVAGIHDLLASAVILASREIGTHLLHAAAVRDRNQALLFIGDSGAGKSTTALCLVEAGCSFLGDDGVFLRASDNGVELRAFEQPLRLTNESLAAFSTLRSQATRRSSDEKWNIDGQATYPGRFLDSFQGPKSLFFLERAEGTDSELLPLERVEALGLLIAGSAGLALDEHPNPQAHLDLLRQLASEARVFRLRLGREWLAAPRSTAERWLAQFSNRDARAS